MFGGGQCRFNNGEGRGGGGEGGRRVATLSRHHLTTFAMLLLGPMTLTAS